MKKSVKILLAIVALGLVVGTITFLYVFRKPVDSVASQKADIVIQADSIVVAFETNENEANARFLDKVVEVKGTIAEITSDTSGYNIVIRNSDAVSGVSCLLGKEQAEKAKALKVGENIVLKGVCTGFLMDVVLNKGAVVEN
jgi:hypothetical protein